MNDWMRNGLAAMTALFFSWSPSQAGGSTMHLAQASYALDQIADPVLKQLLLANLDAYLNGANFPDTFNFPPASFHYTSDESHSGWFLTQYAERVKGSTDDELLAHFMGTLAHVAGDWRFDRYMLTTTTRHCFPDLMAGPAPSFNQDWTDKDFDWLLAPLRLSPTSGILTPSASFVPYEVGHKYGPFSEPSILESAFPGNSTIGSVTLEAAVGIGWTYIQGEHLLAPTADPSCGFAIDHWDTALGAAGDGANAVAKAINTTWGILQSGGTPVFDDYGPPGNPYVEFNVSDATGSHLDCMEFSAWIDGPESVTSFEVEGDRIAALTQPGGPGTQEVLLLFDGEVDAAWVAVLQTAEGVQKVQLAGDRIAVLLGADGRLLVKDGASNWQLQASHVDDFELQGSRLAALVNSTAGPIGLGAVDVGSPATPRLREGLHFKDLAVAGPWKRLKQKVVDFQLQGARIAVRTRNLVQNQELETLQVTDNPASATPQWTAVWTDSHAPQMGPEVSFEIDGSRIGLLVDGTLSVMEGALGGAGVQFTVVGSNVQTFQLEGSYIAALDNSQVLSVLSGALQNAWVAINDSVAEMQLVGSNAQWSLSAPWLAYTTLDGQLMTNRSFAQPSGTGYPTSHRQVMPIYGEAATDFDLGHRSPYAHGNQQIKPMDRLAVVASDQLFFQELPPVAPAPTEFIYMTPYVGLTATWVQLNWDWTNAHPDDFVALYDGDPYVVGAENYLTLQWQKAIHGPTWASNTQWKAGYYMAYIHEDVNGLYHIVDTTGPTQIHLSHLKAVRDVNPLNDWVQLEWDVRVERPAGHRDFVALYDHDPLGGDPNAHLIGEWQWATSSSPWTTGAKWVEGYYVGYVQEDAHGNRTVLSSWGPTTVQDVTVEHGMYVGVSDNWVQLEWSVTDPGTWDYVALFDHDPLGGDPNSYLNSQWQWATKASPWVSGTKWGAGYYVGYVRQNAAGLREVIASSLATTCSAAPTATVSMVYYDGWPFDWIQLDWTVDQVGANDYVAIYNSYPVSPTGYIPGQWQWASGANSWVSGTIWLPGYHAAYIHEDDCGVKTIIARAAPN